jgi:hypothetical protein
MKRIALFVLALVAGCKQPPTSVKVVMSLEASTTPPSQLALSAYDIHGRVINGAPMGNPPILPGDVTVLVNDDAATVRVLVMGKTAQGQTVWAAGSVDVDSGRESLLTLQLGQGTPPDDDGDGVPNVIDNCPEVANGDQANHRGGSMGDACNANPEPGDLGGGQDAFVPPVSCGDGKVDPGEDCDDGPANSDDPNANATCTSGCRKRAACGPLTGAAAAAIDPGTGHCYVSWPNALNWASAQRECQRNGGDLVSITSAGENNLVRGLVATTAWIGFYTAPGATPNFQWVDGEAAGFNGFGPGEPQTGECARLAADGWHADNCGKASIGGLPSNVANTLPYVCESACGNGTIDPGETCDPPGPTCSKTCHTIATCTEPGASSLPENGHCYFSYGAAVSFANVACPAGTHLATLDHAAESEAALKATANADSWIALKAPTTLGVFSWTVGTEVFNPRRYHDFDGTDDPNQPPPACVVVTNLPPSGQPGWRDRGCTTDSYPALCERDQ